jgi:hypothetical protein
MFKKGELRITTAVSAALLAAGCGSRSGTNAVGNGWNATENTAVCTDPQGRRVEDRYCQQRQGYYGGAHYGWYYIPRGGYVPPFGTAARGGSYTASPGAHFTPSGVSAAHVARGGFGSSAHAAAAGGRGG